MLAWPFVNTIHLRVPKHRRSAPFQTAIFRQEFFKYAAVERWLGTLPSKSPAAAHKAQTPVHDQVACHFVRANSGQRLCTSNGEPEESVCNVRQHQGSMPRWVCHWR